MKNLSTYTDEGFRLIQRVKLRSIQSTINLFREDAPADIQQAMDIVNQYLSKIEYNNCSNVTKEN